MYKTLQPRDNWQTRSKSRNFLCISCFSYNSIVSPMGASRSFIVIRARSRVRAYYSQSPAFLREKIGNSTLVASANLAHIVHVIRPSKLKNSLIRGNLLREIKMKMCDRVLGRPPLQGKWMLRMRSACGEAALRSALTCAGYELKKK